MKSLLWILLALTVALVVARMFLAPSGTSPMIGKVGPEIAINTLEGKQVRLSEQRGKVVLLDFWATWCPPCRVSLPHIEELSKNKELAEQGLVVWTVNNEESEHILDFQKKYQYTFPVLLDSFNDIARDYGVDGFPVTLLIGRDGVVQDGWVGFNSSVPKEIEGAIKKALAVPAGK